MKHRTLICRLQKLHPDLITDRSGLLLLQNPGLQPAMCEVGRQREGAYLICR